MSKSLISFLLCSLLFQVASSTHNFSLSSQRILDAAKQDGINLLDFNFTLPALASIDSIIAGANNSDNYSSSIHGGNKIDTHAHSVPNWYHDFVPITAGRLTPNWTLETQIDFMNSLSKSSSTLLAPGSTVFTGNGAASAALARLLNEWHAALVRKYPTRFSFVAVTPLPYTQEAIIEANYTLRKLGAVGIGLLSNHEGYYLGNSNFKPFFEALNNISEGNTTVFIHPNTPYLHVNGTLIDANPMYGSGLVELYFDTARTLMDLVLTGTVQNYSSIMYQIPHTGDAFPSIIDRFLSTASTNTVAIYKILQTRFWWDSAGPTYPHQVQGLLAYDVSKSQLLFGTDYPYGYNYNASLQSILHTSFLEPSDITGILSSNARDIYRIRN
ncbi:hypothetical protein ACMFMG_004801 [Clarireedia jacksonii]